MTYIKQTWHDAPATDTPLSAARLSHMEDGIAAATNAAAAAAQPSDVELKEDKANRNAPNGYAGLDGSGRVAEAQLPDLAAQIGDAGSALRAALDAWFAKVSPISFTVTIPAGKVSETLLGFPVYINLADMPDAFWGKVAAGGGGIRCYQGTTEIPREIVSCDPATRTGELHVRATLLGTADTVLRVTVDGISPDYAVTDAFGRNAVWSGYENVWHLQETTGAYRDSMGGKDSSSVNVQSRTAPGKLSSATPQNTVDGFGGGIAFDANTCSIGTDSLVLSGWFKSADTDPSNDVILSKGASTNAYAVYLSATGKFVANLLSSPGIAGIVNENLADDSWHQFVQVWDRAGNATLYVDGALAAAVSMSGVTGDDISNSSVFAIAGSSFTGSVDEVRARRGAPRESWIAAEYANQNNPSVFYEVSPEYSDVPLNPQLLTIAAEGFGSSRSTLSTNTVGTGRMLFTVGADCDNIVALYNHWYTTTTPDANADTDPSAAISIKASLEVVSSTVPGITLGAKHQFTFGGNDTATVNPGNHFASDRLRLPLNEGDIVAIRTYLASGTAYAPRATRSPSTGNIDQGGFTAGSDLTAPGSVAIPKSTGNYYGPSALLGYPTNPKTTRTFLLLGDSIAAPTGDGGYYYTHDYKVDGGFMMRAIRGRAGLINNAIPGDSVRAFLASGGFRRYENTSRATDAIIEYGTNDLGAGGATATQLEANLLDLATNIRSIGIARAFLTTVIPRTTSTDGWATAANQTPTSSEAQRVAHNTWVRAGCPIDPSTLAPVEAGTVGALTVGQFGHPITGFFDTADAVESSFNSGLWLPARRTVNTGSITSGTSIITSTDAAFDPTYMENGGDLGSYVSIAGAGASGAYLLGGAISSVDSSTQIHIIVNASTTVTNAQLNIGVFTVDGIHPSSDGHDLMSAVIDRAL